MKIRKSPIKLLLASIFVFGLAVTSHAAFTVEDTFNRTAVVTVGGDAEVTLQIEVRDRDNPLVAGDLVDVTWDANVEPSAGVDGWVLANRIVHIDATLGRVNSGVQTYTDNTATGANPKFVDPTDTDLTNSDSMAAGLLFTGDGAETSRPPLPLAWAIYDSSKTVGLNVDDGGINPADPNKADINDPPFDENAFQWHFFKDKYNTEDIDDLNATAYQDGDLFITMIKEGLGYHFGQQPDPSGWGGSPNGEKYVYYQALLDSATPEQTYQTSTLTVESFTE